MTEKTFSAEPSPENLQASGSWFRYLKVSYSHSAVNILKVLLSKVIFTEEPLSEEEIVVLFTVREEVLNNTADDVLFAEKYKWLLFITRSIFCNLEALCIDIPARRKLCKEFTAMTNYGRGIIGKRIYYGAKFRVLAQMKVGIPKKPKAKNRIAVGYRDKGNAKNPSWDGTQPWKEVAMDEWFQTHHVSESKVERRESLFWSLCDQNGYQSWHRQKTKNLSILCRMMKG